MQFVGTVSSINGHNNDVIRIIILCMCPFQFPTVCARWVKTAPCYDATVRDKWHGFHLNVLGVSENKDYVAIFCTVNCANYLDLIISKMSTLNVTIAVRNMNLPLQLSKMICA